MFYVVFSGAYEDHEPIYITANKEKALAVAKEKKNHSEDADWVEVLGYREDTLYEDIYPEKVLPMN